MSNILYRRRLYDFGSAAIIIFMTGVGTGHAQTTDPQAAASDTGQVVVVTGYAKQMESARLAKQKADAITDSVTSDDVGSLPDAGLGEALVRVPGVTTIINNGRGEAQLFTLRGLNADYNAVQVDGFSLPATETSRRNVSLDVIPSSLAQRVDVYKSVSANQTGNAIGGIANLITRSPFDHKGLFVAGRFDLTDWTNKRDIRKRTPSGEAEIIVSDRFGAAKAWGFVVDASYFRRDSSSWDSATDTYSFVDPVTGKNLDKTGSASALAQAYAVPDRQRWLYYDNLRQRGGLFAKLEYKRDDFRVYVTAASFIHQNDEERQSNILIGGNTAVGAIGTSNVTATTGTVTKASAQADLAHYLQNRQISYAQTGFAWNLNAKMRLSADANYAFSTYRQNAALYTYKAAASTAFAYTYSYTPGAFPVFTPSSLASLYNPNLYLQSEKTNTVDKNGEYVFAAKTDFSDNADTSARGLGFSTGLEVRALQRQYDFRNVTFAPLIPANFTLAGVLSATTVTPYNGDGRHLLLIDEAAAYNIFVTNRAAFKDNSSLATNLGSDYHLNETIGAGYIMGRFATDSLRSSFGLRYEETSLSTGSYAASSTKLATTPVYSWSVISQKYGKLLPSANLSYDLSPSLKLRAAFSQTIGRPNYDKLAARSVQVIDTTAATATINEGNPNLKPRESSNLDLSLEYYPSRSTQISAALFHKDIKNEIITLTSTANQDVNGTLMPVTTTQPVNASKSGVDGVEFALVQSHFDALPGAWRGLGFALNGTVLKERPSSITMNNGTVRKLPALVEAAQATLNASLIYEYGPFGARLAYNHASKILWTVATDSPVNDVYYAPTDVWDLQGTYALSRHWTLVAQGKNLSNQRNRRMFGLDQSLLREELDNGRSYSIGVKFKY